ncbi:hypothetical protein ACFRLW_25575 [Streptomyces sp. NPDC056728]
MSLARHTELPDPAVARREISEAVLELGPVIAKQARAHAEAVRVFLGPGGVRGAGEEREAQRLFGDIYAKTGFGGPEPGNWVDEVRRSLDRFCRIGGPHGHRVLFWTAFEPLKKALDRGWKRWHQMEADELEPLLGLLHRGLIELADGLPESIDVQAVRPVPHPPKYARLSEGAFVEEVTEQFGERLAACIDEGLGLYAAVRRGDWSGPRWESGSNGGSQESVIQKRFAAVLGGTFRLQDNVPLQSHYAAAIGGVAEHSGVLLFTPGHGLWAPQAFPEEREIADRLLRRVYSAYVAIAVNYLAEVQELVPRYLELSGQGKDRDPVTVYGNVGAINSHVHNSHLAVADTVTSIGATIQTVTDRGETGVADALRSLAEAIQQAPELAEDHRAQLLHSVADVADAAVAPDEPRTLSRARNAMAAITAAAGASSQLAQAVDAWHQVAGHLF